MSSALHFLLRDLTSIAGAAGLGLLAVCTFGLSGLGQASGWSLSGIPHTCVDGLYAPGCSAAAVQVGGVALVGLVYGSLRPPGLLARGQI
jgi:hypothetical protein